MQKADFLNLIRETFRSMMLIAEGKGVEYAQGYDEVGRNFYETAKDLGITPERALWVYMRKHLDAILFYVRRQTDATTFSGTLSEPIEGRIDDAIMYLMLLKALAADRLEKDTTPILTDVVEER